MLTEPNIFLTCLIGTGRALYGSSIYLYIFHYCQAISAMLLECPEDTPTGLTEKVWMTNIQNGISKIGNCFTRVEQDKHSLYAA